MFCKLVLPSNEIHKLCSLPPTFDQLNQTIQTKLQNKLPQDYSLKYKDSDDDEMITLSCDDDLQAAIMTAKQENVNTLRIFIIPSNENLMAPSDKPLLSSLPGIPEAQEKSRSSLDDPSIGSSYIRFPESQGIDGPLKSCSRFSLSRIPKTQSLIFDDMDTVHSMTPFSEKPGEGGSRKRVFTFTRMNSIEDPIDEEYMSPGPGKSVLTEEQMDFLSNLIDNRLSENIDNHIRNFTLEFLSKIYDDLPFVSPERSSPYNLSMLSKSMIRSNNRRHTLQSFKGPSQEASFCAGCNSEVHGIKYVCLSCPNYLCCENCESEVDHPHPLLKIRPAQQYEQHQHHPQHQTHHQEMKRNSPVNYNTSPSPSANMYHRTSAQGSARKPHRHTTAGPGLMSFGSESQLANITRLYENYVNTQNNTSQPSPTLPVKKTGILRRGNTLGNLPSLKGGPAMGPRSGGGSMSISRYSSKTTIETDGKYKATITKPSVYDFISIHPGQEYNVQLIVKNSGENKWAECVKLICINGREKGMEMPVSSLSPGEEQALSVNLMAPQQSGRCLSQWKLHYSEEEGAMKAFGRAIYIDIEVSEREKGATEETPEADESLEDEAETDELRIRSDNFDETPREEEDPDKILMKEMRCTEPVLTRARMLNDMFPGEIKEKVEFIKKFASNNLDINDIVSAYLARMGHSNKRRATWANPPGIST